MSRDFAYPDGWAEMMRSFTLNYAVGQARSVIAECRTTYGAEFYGQFDSDILRHRYPEWHDWFIKAVLSEMERRNWLNSEQAFHDHHL